MRALRHAAGALLALSAALFITTGAGAATAPHVSGSGTIDRSSFPVTFQFDASGLGSQATGTMSYSDRNGAITAHVVCLSAGSTQAQIVGQIDSSPVLAGEGG